jgi:hypothetical protein
MQPPDPKSKPQPSESRETASNAFSLIGSDARRTRNARLGAPLALATTLIGITAVGFAFAFYGTDANLLVGYSPVQPIDFSHKLHAADLGLDCRFCHTSAERGPLAGIPSSMSCMNCHEKILPDSIKLLPLRATYAETRPIAWVRVTKLAEYTYFDHSAHLSVGVGCETCHGRVDLMLRTEQRLSLSMGFCLDCHRNPSPQLRRPADVTRMGYRESPTQPPTPPPALSPTGRPLTPPLHCGGCHR